MPYDTRVTTLMQSGVAMGVPSSGSMGSNGAITITTALNLTYANCYLYLPAGAAYAGSLAGPYFAQMTSATVGTVYNNILTLGPPVIPSILNPIIGSGPGAYTQTTAALLPLTVLTFPGGSMGNHGSMEFVHTAAYNNSAGSKTFNMLWGGQTLLSVSHTTTVSVAHQKIVTNRGVQNSQSAQATGQIGFGVVSSGVPLQLAQDTSANFTVTYQAQLAVATDTLMYESIRATVFYGA